MWRSQKWPDLRSPISKIRDIHFVGTDELIKFWKFHNFPWNIVAVARLEIYFVVGSLDLTWWPDLTWHWVEIFTKVAENMGGKVGENPAVLRAAVFSLASKTWGGGGVQTPLPQQGAGKPATAWGEGSDPTPLGFSGITSTFITLSTWNLAHLSGHQFGVVSCKENQNRQEIFCYRSNFVTSLHAILGRLKVNVWKLTKNRVFESNANKKWIKHRKARSTKWLSRIF